MRRLRRMVASHKAVFWWKRLPHDPLMWPSVPRELLWYLRSLRNYKLLCAPDSTTASGNLVLYPVLFQHSVSRAPFDAHVVYGAAWAQRRILQLRPNLHVDVSSSIYFVASLSAVVPTLFLEFHPPRLRLSGLHKQHADILSLPFASQSLASISCLHTIEHIGLGRYGDSLNPQGSRDACRELARCVAPGGSLFVSLPIGRRCTYFNAHRVHEPCDIIEYMRDLKLVEFSVVTDNGEFVENADPQAYSHLSYGCGLYWFARVAE